MAIICVTGIVIRYVNYKEADRILSLFTRELGRVDVKARGCRRPKSPLLAASQPFVFGEFELFENKGRYTLNQCDVRESFHLLRSDIDAFAAGSCMLALVQHFVQEHEQNPALFSLLYHCLSFLAYGQCSPIDLALCFILRCLNNEGYCPTITNCAVCGADLRVQETIRFSAHAGGAICEKCVPYAKKVSKLSLEAMRRMLNLQDDELERVKLPLKVQTELLDILQDYCQSILERETKAFSFLKKISDLQEKT